MSVGTTSPESARKSYKRYARSANGKKHIKYRRAVEAAKRRGDLKPPAACPKCGRHVKLDFHHTHGYGKGTELKGVWRCRRCHSAEDRKRNGAAMSRARKKAEATKKREGVHRLRK